MAVNSAERTLTRLDRRLRAFSLCNTAFFQAETEHGVLQSICEILVAEDDLCLAWIGYCENDAQESLRTVAKAGTGVEHFDDVQFSWGSETAGQTPIGVALESGKACWINDISTDPRFSDWRIAATKAGCGSCIAFPLIAQGKRQGNVDLRGALHLCSAERGFFDESAIEHYSGLATGLTSAVAALRSTLAEGLTSGVATLRLSRDRRQLRAMQEELARVTRMLEMGQMAASIAHEISQPLAAIMANANAGLSWISRPSPDLDEARTALKSIVSDGRRAGEVITGIRSIFKKRPQSKAPHNINEMVNEVLTLVRSKVESQQVSVSTELARELPYVLVDRIQLQQVILNLIVNAVEAMSSENSRARMLHLRTETVEPFGVTVTVRDTGPGIDPDSIHRIFDAFFTTKPTGMGLGLAICRSVVDAHGGRLLATRSHPHGSVFQLVLPGHRPGQ